MFAMNVSNVAGEGKRQPLPDGRGSVDAAYRAATVRERLQRRFAAVAFLIAAAWAQGPSVRNAVPAPRSAPSGRPWAVTLTDIASSAGLTVPIVYGGDAAK